MIRTFLHKGLKELFEKGASSRIQKSMHQRCVIRLDALDRAVRPDDMKELSPKVGDGLIF